MILAEKCLCPVPFGHGSGFSVDTLGLKVLAVS